MNIIKLIILLAVLLGFAYLGYTLWHELGRAPKPKLETFASRVPAEQYQNGTFRNQIETPPQSGDFSYTKMIREQISPSNLYRRPPSPIPHVNTKLTELTQRASSIVWFGHSSYLLTLDGFTVLVDPVMSGHSAPLPFLVKSFEGTDAYGVDDLPMIDVLLITHDHYDHLDYETVKKLQPKVKQVVTGLGVGEHLLFWGYNDAQINELNWHESVTINNHQFTATPARHFSGRGLTRNNTLWASFVLKSAQHSIYIGGDSGYGPHFKEIGEQYGPFDLAMLESGQYSPDWAYIHMMPEQTVQAAQDLGVKTLFPVHWGKFVLSLHDWNEPINRVIKAAHEKQQTLLTPQIGQVTDFANLDQGVTPWWQGIEPIVQNSALPVSPAVAQ